MERRASHHSRHRRYNRIRPFHERSHLPAHPKPEISSLQFLDCNQTFVDQNALPALFSNVKELYLMGKGPTRYRSSKVFERFSKPWVVFVPASPEYEAEDRDSPSNRVVLSQADTQGHMQISREIPHALEIDNVNVAHIRP